LPIFSRMNELESPSKPTRRPHTSSGFSSTSSRTAWEPPGGGSRISPNRPEARGNIMDHMRRERERDQETKRRDHVRSIACGSYYYPKGAGTLGYGDDWDSCHVWVRQNAQDVGIDEQRTYYHKRPKQKAGLTPFERFNMKHPTGPLLMNGNQVPMRLSGSPNPTHSPKFSSRCKRPQWVPTGLTPQARQGR